MVSRIVPSAEGTGSDLVIKTLLGVHTVLYSTVQYCTITIQKSEVNIQKPEFRNQNSEFRSQKPEFRIQNLAW